MVALMDSRRAAWPASSVTEFGQLLRVLRHRARLTQRELGVAVGCSEAQICRLEQEGRLPDPAVVAALFLPVLRLGAEPELAGASLRDDAVRPSGDRRAVMAAACPPARRSRASNCACRSEWFTEWDEWGKMGLCGVRCLTSA